MIDHNAPFSCDCGSTLFHALKRFNTLNCELEIDPTSAPMVIECADCGLRFEQLPEWGWSKSSDPLNLPWSS